MKYENGFLVNEKGNVMTHFAINEVVGKLRNAILPTIEYFTAMSRGETNKKISSFELLLLSKLEKVIKENN